MSFIYFCPGCNQKMEVPDEMENTFYPCPYCKVNCLLTKEVDDGASRKTQKIFDQPKKLKPAKPYPHTLLRQPVRHLPLANINVKQTNINQKKTNTNRKQRVIYVLLGIFMGGFGAHNFYAGENEKGIAKVLITVGMILFPFFAVFGGLMGIEAIVEVCTVLGGLVGIWTIVEVCTVDKDANGVPFE